MNSLLDVIRHLVEHGPWASDAEKAAAHAVINDFEKANGPAVPEPEPEALTEDEQRQLEELQAKAAAAAAAAPSSPVPNAEVTDAAPAA